MNPEIDRYENKRWYDSNNKYHREDGPAYEGVSGTKYWFKHGKWHREDGPAIEVANGGKFYYLEDINYSEKEYWDKIKELKKCKLFKLKDNNIDWI